MTPKLVCYLPYPDQPQDHAVFFNYTKRRIGYPNEKRVSGQATYYNYLEKLDSSRAHYANVNGRVRSEINRLCYQLSLSMRIATLSKRRALEYYNMFPKGKHYRCIYLIAPIAIYFTCKEHFIHLPFAELTELILVDKTKFLSCIKEFLKKDKKLYVKFRSAEFRKKNIISKVFGISQLFSVPEGFIHEAIQILDSIFAMVAATKDTVIAGILYYATMQVLGIDKPEYTKQCRFLGIAPSTIHRNKLQITRQKE